MTAATVAVALAQHFGTTVPQIFTAIGVAGLAASVAIWRTMPRKTGPISSAS
jgi:hypothetical protein